MSTVLRSVARAPLASLALLALALAACRGATSLGPHSKLVVDGTPLDATVLVDEQPIGSLAVVHERGVALPPGQHRLTVQADGYFPADLLVGVDKGGGLLRRTVHLVALPEP